MIHIKSAVKRLFSFVAEKKGKKFHTFLSVKSVSQEKEVASTSTELQSQSHQECANCKKAQSNLKKCVLVAKSNTVVMSAKEHTGKNTNPSANNQVQHLLLLQQGVHNVKSKVFVFPAPVGQCSTAV